MLLSQLNNEKIYNKIVLNKDHHYKIKYLHKIIKKVLFTKKSIDIYTYYHKNVYDTICIRNYFSFNFIKLSETYFFIFLKNDGDYDMFKKNKKNNLIKQYLNYNFVIFEADLSLNKFINRCIFLFKALDENNYNKTVFLVIKHLKYKKTDLDFYKTKIGKIRFNLIFKFIYKPANKDRIYINNINNIYYADIEKYHFYAKVIKTPDIYIYDDLKKVFIQTIVLFSLKRNMLNIVFKKNIKL